MKLGNHKNSVNPISEKISRNCFVPFTNVPFASASNYINKANVHPSDGDLIHVKDIVLSREELIDNKWLILPPSPPNPEFKNAVIKFINSCRGDSTWIVIQSEEHMKIEKVKEEEATLKREKENEERNAIYKCNCDHARFNCQDPSKIDSELITAKYHSIDDFKNSHPEYDGEMIGKFNLGDEIWHYNERIIKRDFGQFCEYFLLIRNNTIIYSPQINCEFRDSAHYDNFTLPRKLNKKSKSIKI